MILTDYEKHYLRSKEVWKITTYEKQGMSPDTATKHLEKGNFKNYVKELKLRNEKQPNPFEFMSNR